MTKKMKKASLLETAALPRPPQRSAIKTQQQNIFTTLSDEKILMNNININEKLVEKLVENDSFEFPDMILCVMEVCQNLVYQPSAF